MASKIKVAEVSNAAGTGPATLTGQAALKSWMNYKGTSTNEVRNSLNVSSVTDNGTGNYTKNFTNNMADANSSATSQGEVNGGNNDIRRNTRIQTVSASDVDVFTGYNSASDTKEDWAYVYVQVVGDLA